MSRREMTWQNHYNAPVGGQEYAHVSRVCKYRVSAFHVSKIITSIVSARICRIHKQATRPQLRALVAVVAIRRDIMLLHLRTRVIRREKWTFILSLASAARPGCPTIMMLGGQRCYL